MYDPVLLRSFLAVEHYGGFTAAARQLGLRQPTVSGHIARLERQIGRELFARDTHRVVLTSDGAAMLGFARDIVDAQQKAERYFGGEELAGHIRFGVSEDLVAQALPAILLEFRSAYPQVDLELTVGLSEEIHAQLRADELDLAFVKRRPGEKHGQLVFEDRLVWAGPAGPDARTRATESPVPVVTYHPPSLTRDAALRALERARIPYRITCTTQGQLGLRAAVLAGLGYIVHSESLLPADLHPVDGLPSPGTTQFTLITSARRAQSPPERALIRAIVENTHRLRRPGLAGRADAQGRSTRPGSNDAISPIAPTNVDTASSKNTFP
ncbi:LysR family transcriptional regulator [Rhodococcus triatomae]|uniref:DNA-binding transcriptional regulator, LysR family n=1 Tax=Rhodococcus triatomae TaxID=300028 RepID=A0A1G8L3A0_9NOCA|nr:LysR family transcriptional regulator [Rhodococcus triatomae]QNG25706.1 LysR family transcriptional regulator [Rhodococcus triatomae]SDI50199.1 DNA-binding transcriptional regulator, LysR family [Rhodococcus triatomae]